MNDVKGNGSKEMVVNLMTSGGLTTLHSKANLDRAASDLQFFL